MAKKEKAALKRGTSQFTLIGRAKVSQYTYNINKESEKSDWIYNTLNLGVDCGQGNIVYADMMGGYGAERDNVLFVHGKKAAGKDSKRFLDDYENQFKIAWEDRFDKDILNTIGDQCFITVGLERIKSGNKVKKEFTNTTDAANYVKFNLIDAVVINSKDIEGKPVTKKLPSTDEAIDYINDSVEKQLTEGDAFEIKGELSKTVTEKFLSQYDAIEYISTHLEDGMIVNVKGNLQYQIYNDNTTVKKNITSIYLSKAEDESKFKAGFTQTILLDSKAIHKKDKETGIYPITAIVIDYTKMFNNKEVKTNIPFNVSFEIEEDKNKPENTKKFLEKVIKVKADITELTVEGEIIEGQALTEITDEDIPEDIQELIDMGAITREEVVGKMAVNNNIRTRRWVIKKPLIKMVGESDDDKRPIIQKVERAYTEDDLILDFMYETEDEEVDEDTAIDNADDDAGDADSTDDEDDWLNQLDD